MMKTISNALLFLALTTVALRVSADYPIVSQRSLADPGAMVYNGRVYLYCSNDDDNLLVQGYQMKSIVCVSSSDMKNWTDHGEVLSDRQFAHRGNGVGGIDRHAG